MADDKPNGERESRQPHDMKGLLKFCLENTRGEDAPNSTTMTEMSPERKEWLMGALNEMVSNTPIKQVKELISSVLQFLATQNPSEQSRDNVLQCLQALSDWCEDQDIANDFIKLSGFDLPCALMLHEDGQVRQFGYKLVGSLVQNYAHCQRAAVQKDLVSIILARLHKEADPKVQHQAVQAISCLIRDNPDSLAREQFVAHNGFAVLKHVLDTPGPFRRVARVAFFLGVLCQGNTNYKDSVCEAGIVEQLVQAVKGEHEQQHEHVMGALLCMATDHLPCQQLLCRLDLQMLHFLKHRIHSLNGEENQEEKQYAEDLLNILQSGTTAQSSTSSASSPTLAIMAAR